MQADLPPCVTPLVPIGDAPATTPADESLDPRTRASRPIQTRVIPASGEQTKSFDSFFSYDLHDPGVVSIALPCAYRPVLICSIARRFLVEDGDTDRFRVRHQADGMHFWLRADDGATTQVLFDGQQIRAANAAFAQVAPLDAEPTVLHLREQEWRDQVDLFTRPNEEPDVRTLSASHWYRQLDRVLRFTDPHNFDLQERS